MATSKYIRGLSGAGFRVPDNGSATALQRVTENLNASAHNYQVDLDDDRTQKILAGEKDNFVRVAANTSTTVTVIGLTRYGFRIKNSAGAIVTIKLGSGVHTLTLNPLTLRVLRRNYGRYLFAASATSVIIRGIVAQQNGFDIKSSTAGPSTSTITSSNVNVTALDTVVVGTKTYTFVTALTEAKATDTLVAAASGDVTAGDTVTVNGVVYTFRASVSTTANEVLVAGTADGSLDNLIVAINAGAGSGVKYGSATVANAFVTAGARSTHTSTLTAKTVGVAGNAYTLAVTITASKISRGAATFSSGVDAIANEVFRGGSADASLTNLSEAINAGANVGVDYSTGTVANPNATAGADDSVNHRITVTAVEGGTKEIAISTTAATLTVGNATLQDKLSRVYSGVSVTVNPQDPSVYTQLRRHFKSYIEA